MILIVEDNELLSKLLSELMLSKGVKSMIAPNGIEALKLLVLHKFEVIVSDINMPGMDGFELAKMFKQNVSAPFLHYSSAATTPEYLEMSIRSGADKYIEKKGTQGIADEIMSYIKPKKE